MFDPQFVERDSRKSMCCCGVGQRILEIRVPDQCMRIGIDIHVHNVPDLCRLRIRTTSDTTGLEESLHDVDVQWDVEILGPFRANLHDIDGLTEEFVGNLLSHVIDGSQVRERIGMCVEREEPVGIERVGDRSVVGRRQWRRTGLNDDVEQHLESLACVRRCDSVHRPIVGTRSLDLSTVDVLGSDPTRHLFQSILVEMHMLVAISGENEDWDSIGPYPARWTSRGDARSSTRRTTTITP